MRPFYTGAYTSARGVLLVGEPVGVDGAADDTPYVVDGVPVVGLHAGHDPVAVEPPGGEDPAGHVAAQHHPVVVVRPGVADVLHAEVVLVGEEVRQLVGLGWTRPRGSRPRPCRAGSRCPSAPRGADGRGPGARRWRRRRRRTRRRPGCAGGGRCGCRCRPGARRPPRARCWAATPTPTSRWSTTSVDPSPSVSRVPSAGRVDRGDLRPRCAGRPRARGAGPPSPRRPRCRAPGRGGGRGPRGP